MTSKNNRQKRRSNRRRSATGPRRMVTILGGIIMVGTILLMITATGTGDMPDVADSRLELDPVMGNPDAPVTIVMYGAYACSACRAWHQAGIVELILAEFPDQVNFVFRDFPVIFPAYDRMAAEVAHCALDQSEAGFWALHDALYTTIAPGSSQENILRTGEQLDLDGEALRTCAEENTHRVTVQYHEERGRHLGLPGTPSFFVNDTRLFSPTPDVLRATVEQALANAG